MKRFLLLILFVFMSFILLFSFHKKKNDIGAETIISTHIPNDNLVYNVEIDNILCPYNKLNSMYYFSTSDFSKYDIFFHSDFDVKYIIYGIDDNIYHFLVYDDKYYTMVSILVDSIPVINIYDMGYFSNDALSSRNDIISIVQSENEDKFVGIQIINLMQNNGTKYFTSIGNMSIRGASSTFFQKKSYKLKLENDLGVLNVSNDKVWVLDALYADPSKVRNKLSSDLWNLINDNQKINNDLSTQFVELFINNEYRGLYVLKEKVDKSVTKIQDNGLLLKAVGHLDSTMVDRLFNNEYSIYDNKILNFEVKNYDKSSISSFLKKIKDFYYNNRNYDSIVNTFDLDNYINYKIFVSLLCGEDNVTSNQYYSMVNSNSKILVTPWDMDLTWGSFWNFNRPTLSEFIWDKDYDYNWLDESIFGEKDDKTFSLLKKRYWELRKNVITMDTINSYLDSYKDILVNSGATKRDSERWYNYDVVFEIEQIREWARKRIFFLDEYFK